MTEGKEVAVREAMPAQPNGKPPAAVTVGAMLEMAITKGVSPEGLEKLVGVYERMMDRQAAQDFADALMAFQADCPPIARTAKADIVSKRSGARYSYRYAPLDEIANTVRPHLQRHGFSYSWDSAVSEDGKRLTATCWLRHRNGHRESADFQVPVENPSGMNEQQQNGAALSYAKRQSLVAVLGLTTTDPDYDGNDPSAPVSPEQLARLEELFEGLKLSKGRFFRTLALPEDSQLKDIPAVLFPTAQNLLLMKRNAEVKAEGPAQ